MKKFREWVEQRDSELQCEGIWDVASWVGKKIGGAVASIPAKKLVNWIKGKGWNLDPEQAIEFASNSLSIFETNLGLTNTLKNQLNAQQQEIDF